MRNLKLETVRFTSLKEEDTSNYNVLIIDNVGMLSSVYRYADVAYVGGGFGSGIHNILEPAVFGVPVIFGPMHAKFKEASELVDRKGAFSISNFSGLKEWLDRLITDDNFRLQTGKICADYVSVNAGATKKILEIVQPRF